MLFKWLLETLIIFYYKTLQLSAECISLPRPPLRTSDGNISCNVIPPPQPGDTLGHALAASHLRSHDLSDSRD